MEYNPRSITALLRCMHGAKYEDVCKPLFETGDPQVDYYVMFYISTEDIGFRELQGAVLDHLDAQDNNRWMAGSTNLPIALNRAHDCIENPDD